MKFLGSAARTAYFLKKIQGLSPNWKINYKLKCISTEHELTNFIRKFQIKKDKPVVIIAKEQSSAFGQNSRVWVSPKGGIWLSAAYPIFSNNFSSEDLSLSLAIKLCEMLEEESIKVKLKWPNDILFNSKKLIGFLPRVITRGRKIIYVRIGLGMNFLNKTPEEGISLSEILNKKQICQYYWTAKILKTINEAILINGRKKFIIEKANKYLTKNYLPKGYSSNQWQIKEIDNDGHLRIFDKDHEKILKRF